MANKRILFSLFVIVAIIQLAVPAKMIWDREKILETGKEFKFETAPIDPTDPFRGKYIILSFTENKVLLNSDIPYTSGEKIFVILKKDQQGFAKIKAVTNKKPKADIDYVQASVEYVSEFPAKTLSVSYPFNRYYMEESKAYQAERVYIESQLDSTKTTYALVSIKNGKAVLKDIIIDGVPILQLVKEIERR